MNGCTHHSARSADERGSHTTLAGTQSQSVSRCRSPRHHAPFTPPFRSIRDLTLTSRAILSRVFFVLVFLFFLFSEKVREEGLFLGYNLSVFLDIILKLIKINIFFLRERVCKSFGQVFIFFWNCDAFQRFFRTFAREIWIFSNLYKYIYII